MNVLSGFLIFCGIACLISSGAPFLFILAPLFFIGGILCLNTEKPQENNTFKKKSGDVISDGYSGSTQGDYIDLGNGIMFDTHDPDKILDYGWRSDNSGGYDDGSGRNIRQNNNSYDLSSSSDEDDDSFHSTIHF